MKSKILALAALLAACSSSEPTQPAVELPPGLYTMPAVAVPVAVPAGTPTAPSAIAVTDSHGSAFFGCAKFYDRSLPVTGVITPKLTVSMTAKTNTFGFLGTWNGTSAIYGDVYVQGVTYIQSVYVRTGPASCP